MRLRKVTFGLTAALALAVFAAGCSDATAGSPTASGPGTGTTSTEPSTSTSTTSSTPKGDPDFSNTALCELLTPDEATQLGGSAQGEPGNSIQDGHPQCTWSDATSLIVGFQKGSQYEAPTGPDITNSDITIAGKAAVLSKRVTSVRTNCQVIVKLSDDAVISTLAGLHDAGVGKFEECDLATKFADVVVPKVLEYY